MRYIVELASRILVILSATGMTLYLLSLSTATGDSVDINERWFEYGKASAPVAKESLDDPLAYSIMSPVEKDENEEPFYWITENGDVLAISNLSEVSHSAQLTFEISNNPCKNERNLVVGNNSGPTIITSPKKGTNFYSINISVGPLDTEFLSIAPLPGTICNLNNSDERNFVTKISKINLDLNKK